MRKSENLRQYAENCADLADRAANDWDKARFKRMQQAWIDLATNQDWLDGEEQSPARAVV
jgi:hypothetical protein